MRLPWDLATIFLSRTLTLASCGGSGTVAIVTPQTLLFLSNYRRLRQRLLRDYEWNVVVRLGQSAFTGMNWWAANTCLIVVTNDKPSAKSSLGGLDVSVAKQPSDKAALLRGVREGNSGPTLTISLLQYEQLNNANSRILLNSEPTVETLAKYAGCYAGLSAGDIERFVRYFWDLPVRTAEWEFMQNSFTGKPLYGGMSEIILWESGHGEYLRFVEEKLGPSGVGAWIRGEVAWGKCGILIVKMNALPSTLYMGNKYGANVYAIIPKATEYLLPILAYTQDPEFRRNCREVDQKTDIANQAVLDIPFDLGKWQQHAAKVSRLSRNWTFLRAGLATNPSGGTSHVHHPSAIHSGAEGQHSA